MKQISMNAEKIAEIVGGSICGDPARIINGVSGIKDAASDQLSFVGNKKYEDQLNTTNAGIILVCKDLASASTENRTLIVCENVDFAFAKITALFAEEPPAPVIGIHPAAVVDPSAKIGQNVSIGANAVIEAGAEIADNAVIGAVCYIGHDAKIGAGTILYPGVTVMYRCTVGAKCIIHPGVVIGADGFGFIPGPQGLVKVPQTGIVCIGNDVEIGANTTIDRARFGKTVIKDNVKIDDQVMVAHNVVVGESSILVAQCGIAGSSELGRGVILAGQAGVNGHITIGDGCQIAGTSSVVKSLPPGSIALGTPAEPQRDFLGRLALPKKVQKLDAKIKELEAKIKELSK
ncbi:MAG: UDP-3-O-(3-hydroxymyristoyl)glucosamine N-acyltransferase [Lentisphaeria bacterium]|nr:UDP-3-O-(3-hydroxymyristoyl)glucosamine N-acyltransferase [Lentisphaerota bacterium]MBR2625334.1 UDP-3-O-(3-hydroxymyristoyl)glucosamine N-acyltransferase [Lentisphaeria bacterium]